MPKENLDELAFAPINPDILKKPEVFLAIPIGVAAGIGVLLLTDFLFPSPGQQPTVQRDPVEKSFSPSNFLFAEAFGAATYLSVGIGEESFFRGAIQPMLSEPLGQVGGLIGSSLLFGAAHIPNAWQYHPNDARERNKWFASALPYITLGGFYLGYLQMKNHSLKEAVAVHSWYDFALFTISTLTRSLSISGATQIPSNFSFTFAF